MNATHTKTNEKQRFQNVQKVNQRKILSKDDKFESYRENSMLIVKKKKIINKKLLKSFLKKQAISTRFTNKSDQKFSENNEGGFLQNNRQQFQSLKNQNFINFIQNHTENVTCPICISELIQPIVTNCAHLFCLQCIEKSLLNGNNCPLCRQSIADEQNFGLSFDRQAQKLVQKLNVYKSKQERQEHHKTYYQWKNRRFLTDVQIYLQANIDLWMAEGSWHTGKIKQIYREQNNKIESLLIQIQKSTIIIKQIVQVDSFRLAKPQFYNKKKSRYDQFRIGLRQRQRRGNNTSLEHLLDRTRNLFTTQVFQLRSRIFFGQARANLQPRQQREVEELGATPFIHRVQSEVLSNGYMFQSDRNEDSLELANLQPFAPVQNNIEFQNINLSRLNPQTNNSVLPNYISSSDDSDSPL